MQIQAIRSLSVSQKNYKELSDHKDTLAQLASLKDKYHITDDDEFSEADDSQPPGGSVVQEDEVDLTDLTDDGEYYYYSVQGSYIQW